MRIILARHGETDYNKNKKVQGHSDIPLNEEGIKQGKEAGKKITDYDIDVAYSSTLGRAFDTARYMLDNSNNEINKMLDVIKDKRLIEKSYGDYEGISFAEYAAGLQNGETRGMELDADAADRVEEFFKENNVDFTFDGEKLKFIISKEENSDEILKQITSKGVIPTAYGFKNVDSFIFNRKRY